MNLELLRPFDLAAALRGEPICYKDGSLRDYIDGPDDAGSLCVKGDGRLVVGHQSTYRMSPITWVDETPVYPGDTLYAVADGAKVRVEALGIRRECGQFFKWSDLPPDCFTWEAPEVTRRVKVPAWLSPAGQLVWYAEGRAMPPGCVRVPSEDKEIEVTK